MYTIVTNNKIVKERYENSIQNLTVEYLNGKTCLDILVTVRDYIHKGFRLETHPMAGSVKPNQNPYKSVMISDDPSDSAEFQEFITVMENSIMMCRDFLAKKSLPEWPEALLADFRFMDQSLIENGAERIRR